MKVRVRFAPSPTGFLHIGSARTALFNWLFARHSDGEFLLRIEDTDKVRSKDEFLTEILASLKWLGMDWDGELIFQSKRLKLYKKYAQRLIELGRAYEAEGAVHFKMPEEKIKINDLVHGTIEFDSSLIDDLVMIKSDGFPTYNFACVVDDAEMEITHVIRGDDHISNTPKQIPIYEALGFKLPEFAHIPLILGKDSSRLSKRHGAASISDYKAMGYLPEALVNFIALLGWSAGGDREIIRRDEIIKLFDLSKVNKTNSIFDIDKCNWMNGEYIKMMDADELADSIRPFLLERCFIDEKFDRKKLMPLVKLYQGRIKTLADFCEQAYFFFTDEIKFDEEAVKKFLKGKETAGILKRLSERLAALEKFDAAAAEEAVRGSAAELGIKAAEIIHPVRVAITGKSVSPGLFEVMELLGKEKVIRRLSRCGIPPTIR